MGRESSGIESIGNCVSFRAGLNCPQGEFPTGKALLSLAVRRAKYGA